MLKEEVILDIFNEKESETFPCLYFYISYSTLRFFNIGISFLLIRICKTNFSFQQQKIKSMRVTSPVLQLFIDLLLLLSLLLLLLLLLLLSLLLLLLLLLFEKLTSLVSFPSV